MGLPGEGGDESRLGVGASVLSSSAPSPPPLSSSASIDSCVYTWICVVGGADEPVNRSASSSAPKVCCSVMKVVDEESDGYATKFEKVHACAIAADVEIVVEQPTGFEAELGEVVPTVVADEDEPAGFQYLGACVGAAELFYNHRGCENSDLRDIGDGARPFGWV